MDDEWEKNGNGDMLQRELWRVECVPTRKRSMYLENIFQNLPLYPVKIFALFLNKDQLLLDRNDDQARREYR
jgi:hypothetical protein